MKKSQRKIIYVALIYIIILIFIKILRGAIPLYAISNRAFDGINLIPFKTIIEYIKFMRGYNSSTLVYGFFSFFMFTPLILFFIFDGYLKDTNSKEIFLYLLYSSVIYSLINRLMMIGSFDIDSIILRALFPMGIYFLIKNFSLKIV